MKKNIILLISALILIGLIFILIRFNSKEESFNEVKLSTNNTVINNNLPKYLDTIMSVGLDLSGLVGVNVVMLNMSENAQNSLPDYELKAHIREWNGTYYLFLGSVSRNEAIRVLSHEIIHIHQYHSQELQYLDGKVYWLGDEYDLTKTEYDKRPWEENAFDREKNLSNAINSVLLD